MFYSYDVLHPRKGKFAIIWLVATGRLSYSKRQEKNFREVMSVKITRTCDEIMAHVSLSAPGKSRFSLYLSTMLLYGTVKVYHRQVRFLLEEVSNIFKTLQRQSSLLMDLDVTVPGQMRVTLREPLSFEDFDDLLLMPPPALDLLSATTPRKHSLITPVKKRGKAQAEKSPAKPEQLRDQEIVEGQEDVTFLLRDWEETPTRARIEDITMREDDVSSLIARELFTDQEPGMEIAGPLDLGPPFFMLEDVPFAALSTQQDAEAVKKRPELDKELLEKDKRRDSLDKDDSVPRKEQVVSESELREISTRTEAIGPLEEQPPQPEPSEQPLVPLQQPLLDAPEEILQDISVQETIPTVAARDAALETPAQSPKEAVAERLRKKAKARPAEPDATPVAAPSAEQRPLDVSQIVLLPVHRPVRHHVPARYLNTLIIDAETQLSRTLIRNQCFDASSTMRHATAEEDMFDSKKIKFVDGSAILGTLTHRNCMAGTLKKLITRNYHPDMDLSRFDFSPVARKRLQLEGESFEHQREREASVVVDTSSVSTLESSKEAARRSILQSQSLALEASVLPSMFPELIPIQEEAGAEVPPLEADAPALPSEVPVISEDLAQPGVQVIESSEVSTVLQKPLPHKRLREKPDESIGLASPPKTPRTRRRTPVILEAPPGTLLPSPRRGPPPSPEGGLKSQTVEVDVHHIPHSAGGLAEEINILDAGLQEKDASALEVPGEATLVRTELGTDVTQQLPLQEEQDSLLPPGPTVGSEPFIPSFISPIRHADRPSRLLQSPDTYHLTFQEMEFAIRNTFEVEKRQHLIFDQLLPANPTRRDAANVFSSLLEMHRQRAVRLSQECNYGTIFVENLSRL